MAFPLTPEQRTIAEIQSGLHAVNAGPGSGKTRTMVERTAALVSGDAIPSRVLCVTFSKKAAKEYQERLAASGAPGALYVNVRTLHSWGYAVLREEGLCNGKPVVGHEVLQVLRGIFTGLQLEEDESLGFTPEKMRGYISQAKLLGLTPEGTRAALRDSANTFRWPHPTSVRVRIHGQQVYEEYDRRTWQAGRPDFDDMVLRPYLFFKADTAAVDRWAAKYDHIMVDEAQDNSEQQQFVMMALATRIKSFVQIGDDEQSIYRFRGAKPKVFIDFARREDVTVHSITLNHRSTRSIVEACDRLIHYNTNRLEKTMRPGRTGTFQPQLIQPIDAYAQALAVVDEIRRDLKAQIPLSEIAVLYRVRRSSAPVETALNAAGISYLIAGRRSFYDRPHIRVILDYLRLVSTYKKSEVADRDVFVDALSRVYYQPRRYLGKAWLGLAQGPCEGDLRDPRIATGRWSRGNALLLQALETLHRVFLDGSLSLLVQTTLRSVKGSSGVDLRTHLIAHADLDGAEDDEATPLDDDWAQMMAEIARHETVAAFLAHAERLVQAAKSDDESVPAVRLGTIHSVKGAEYKSVHLIDAVENRLPHYYALQADIEQGGVENLEEERRLCFVAMSRAAERLRVYAPASELRRGRRGTEDTIVDLQPSRFIAEAELSESAISR